MAAEGFYLVQGDKWISRNSQDSESTIPLYSALMVLLTL
ncbi:hypothetical protein SAMN05216522_111107 [Rosenbergiella nectarea]|uniref:Uncharacterized protein n=1 Tax=Rosenbergiella nectarea TaxID=988801 RepID=A0A1H9LIW5_9GAMM|nr:hypothetical protein SAMN05216522_111107 [Rosenbergiella nectarea]